MIRPPVGIVEEVFGEVTPEPAWCAACGRVVHGCGYCSKPLGPGQPALCPTMLGKAHCVRCGEPGDPGPCQREHASEGYRRCSGVVYARPVVDLHCHPGCRPG